MTTFRRTLSVNMEDPPDVERWRMVTRLFYFTIFFGAFVFGACLAIEPVPNTAPDQIAEFRVNPEAHADGVPER